MDGEDVTAEAPDVGGARAVGDPEVSSGSPRPVVLLLIDLREQSDELGRHGGQNHDAARYATSIDVTTPWGRITIAMTSMGEGRSHFQMAESFDETGVLCLSLIGELDLAVGDDLAVRLRQLQEQGLEVRLDLTQLEFIDSTGLRELMCAIDSSRRDGSRLTVGTQMTSAVRRVVELAGAAPYFRPEGD